MFVKVIAIDMLESEDEDEDEDDDDMSMLLYLVTAPQLGFS